MQLRWKFSGISALVVAGELFVACEHPGPNGPEQATPTATESFLAAALETAALDPNATELVAPSLSFRPSSGSDRCLAVEANVAPANSNAPSGVGTTSPATHDTGRCKSLTLVPCAATPAQSWALVDGYLRDASGLCVAAADPCMATNSNTTPNLPRLGAVAMPCDAMNPAHQVTWMGGGLVVESSQQRYALTDAGPAGLGFVQVTPGTVLAPWTGTAASSEATGSAPGVHVSVSAPPGECLAADGAGVVLSACANTPAQLFRLQADQSIVTSAGCLTAKGEAISTAPCDGSTSQRWVSKGGLLFATSNCLCATKNARKNDGSMWMATCDFARNTHFAFGAR